MFSLDSKFAFSGLDENERLIRRKVKIDSKGRISIPSVVRKNFGLEEAMEIEIVFSTRKNFVVLNFNNGQDGVTGSTEACGASGLGSNPGLGPSDFRKSLRRY